jgi:hypothetical protein
MDADVGENYSALRHVLFTTFQAMMPSNALKMMPSLQIHAGILVN